MTRFATVLVGRTGELSFMNILVTVLALCLGDLEKSVFTLPTLRQVTLVASRRHVTAFEWIFCGCMILDSEGRRFPAIHGMTGGAFSTIGTSAELTFVRIFVAIHALRKWNGRLEVAVGVAVAARDRFVFAKEGEFCFGVVKSLQLSDLIPFRGVVA